MPRFRRIRPTCPSAGFPNRRRAGEKIYTYGAHPYQFAFCEAEEAAWTLGWREPTALLPRLGLMIQASRLHARAAAPTLFAPQPNATAVYNDGKVLMVRPDNPLYFFSTTIGTALYDLADLGNPSVASTAGVPSSCIFPFADSGLWISWRPYIFQIFYWPPGVTPYPQGGVIATVNLAWGQWSQTHAPIQQVWYAGNNSVAQSSHYTGHDIDLSCASVAVRKDADTVRLFVFGFAPGGSWTYSGSEKVPLYSPTMFITELVFSLVNNIPKLLSTRSQLGVTTMAAAFDNFDVYKHLQNPGWRLTPLPAFVPKALACEESHILTWGFIDWYGTPHYYAMLAGTDEVDPGPCSELTGPITAAALGCGYYSDGQHTYRWNPGSGSSTLLVSDWAWPFPAPGENLFVGRVEDGYHHPYCLVDPDTGGFL